MPMPSASWISRGGAVAQARTPSPQTVWACDRRVGSAAKIAPPTGAFYVLANARRYTSDSLAFAFELLDRAHVAVTPGIDFGANAEGYLRFCYTKSVERIEEALARIGRVLAEREPAGQGAGPGRDVAG